MNIKHISNALFVFIVFSLISCQSEKSINTDSDNLKFFVSRTDNKLIDTLLFTNKEIRYFNGTTNELAFTSSLNTEKLNSYKTIRCYLNSDSLFSATIANTAMSVLINDLVLYHNLHDDKYYFDDGYPGWIDNIGATTLRAQNKAKREEAWIRFIAELKKVGKYTEN